MRTAYKLVLSITSSSIAQFKASYICSCKGQPYTKKHLARSSEMLFLYVIAVDGMFGFGDMWRLSMVFREYPIIFCLTLNF